MKKDKDILKIEFTLDPYQGFAMQAVSAIPVGYCFVKMERQGKRGVVYYRKDK